MKASEISTSSSPDFSSREELERLLIENLLTSTEERVFFKDLHGRYLMVSAGWLAAEGGGRALDEVLGATDFDLFGEDYASVALIEEQRVIETGRALVAQLERQTYDGRPPAWVSTTRVPLRSRDGRVIGTFGTTRDVTATVQIHDALTYQALHDQLTGLVNRVALTDRLAQALLVLERRPGWVGVLFIDLDGFKLINDALGHEAGDRVLVESAKRLAGTARRVDTVARFGGDEFVVLCGELRAGDDLALVAERVVRILGEPVRDVAGLLPVGASVGGAYTNSSELDAAALLRAADLAMYAAKRAGGNRYAIEAVGSRALATA